MSTTVSKVPFLVFERLSHFNEKMMCCYSMRAQECSDPHFCFIKGPLKKKNQGYTSGPVKRHFNL